MNEQNADCSRFSGPGRQQATDCRGIFDRFPQLAIRLTNLALSLFARRCAKGLLHRRITKKNACEPKFRLLYYMSRQSNRILYTDI